MPAGLATEVAVLPRRRPRRISDRRLAVLIAAGSLSLYGGLVLARPGVGAIHALPGAAPVTIGFTFGLMWGGLTGLLASVAVGAALYLHYGSALASWPVADWLVGSVLLVGAGVLSGVVARLRFHRTVELLRLVRELHRARAVLAALYESGKLITSELDMDRLIDRLLRLVRDMFGYPNPAILLVDEEAGGLRLAGAYGYDTPDNLRIPLDRGITGYVARTGLAVRVDDVTRDTRYIPGVRGARSEMAVPIRIKERVLGVLNVESEKVAAFTDEDVRVLQMVADQAAVALQNAHLLGLTAHMAVTDPLTELYNRRYFMQQLELKVERARRSGVPVSLVLMDIDDFKHFNDQFGHLVGDEVLRLVGQLIRKNVRRTDLAARYGGEEFTILLPDADPESAAALAHRVQAALPETQSLIRELTEAGTPVSVSVGVACFPLHARDWRELIERADEACYEAKRLGKNRVVVWSCAARGAAGA